jgi:hypothetical protein
MVHRIASASEEAVAGGASCWDFDHSGLLPKLKLVTAG